MWKDEKTGEERRYYEALYPIQPTTVNFIEDLSGRLFTQFIFANGYDTTIPYDNVIHWKYRYSVNQYMGGGFDGQPDHKALLSTLDLNEKMLQGIAKAMNASYTVNGVVKFNTLIDDEATVKRFYKEHGHFRLQPENPTMEPILVDHVGILGKVVMLYRKY